MWLGLQFTDDLFQLQKQTNKKTLQPKTPTDVCQGKTSMVHETSEGHFSAKQMVSLSLVSSSYIISNKYVWYKRSKRSQWQEKKLVAGEKVNFKPRWWHEALRRANAKSLKGNAEWAKTRVSLPNGSQHKQSNIPTVCSWTLTIVKCILLSRLACSPLFNLDFDFFFFF